MLSAIRTVSRVYGTLLFFLIWVLLFTTVLAQSNSNAQDSVAIFSEFDDGSLKGKTGQPSTQVFHFRDGKLYRHPGWSDTRRNGWLFALSPSGRVIYASAKPSTKPEHSIVRFYLADSMSPPDFSKDKPFLTREVKRTDRLPPGAGLSASWSPDEKRFFIRSPFELATFEESKLLGTLDRVSWSWGVNWLGNCSRLGVCDHQGRRHWTTKAPLKGQQSFDSKQKPYINYELRNNELLEGKIHSYSYRVLYSPDGKYLAYARAQGDRPLVNPSLNKVREIRYDGPVTGTTSLRVGVRGKSKEVVSYKNTAKVASQEKFKDGFSGKTMINGEVRNLVWTQITPIAWSQNSDAFYFVVSKFDGKSVWSYSNRNKEGVFGQLKSNELWRATPSGSKIKICDLKYMPDMKRYCGNMASRFPDMNESRVSADGKHLIFWGSSTSFYKKNLTKLEFSHVSRFVPARAAPFARYLIMVDLVKGTERKIFTGSTRSREFSVAGFRGSNLKIKSLTVLDANPKFHGDGKSLPNQLLPTQLIKADTKRSGTTADGVSQLILRAEVSAKVPVVFRISEGEGIIAPLLDSKTVSLQGKHYAFCLYTPPKNFVGGSSKSKPSSLSSSSAKPVRLQKNCAVEFDNFKVEAIPYRPLAGGQAQPVLSGRKERELTIARPPVVLVHGLGSNPIECWVATKPNGESMVRALEGMGIQSFCVNYEKSNGLNDPDSPNRQSFLFQPDGRKSTFLNNRNVVWDSPDGEASSQEFLKGFRWLGEEKEVGWLGAEPIDKPEIPRPAFLKIGGIKQALDFYREELKIAATQADVIGHSMGGLLARVHADPNYNPTYRRHENFNQGDIHRLITICTPHHGSELAMLYNEVFRNLMIDDESFVEWARANVQQKLLTMFLDPDSGAITDLRYRSRALQRIGRTEIPSFAIATTANKIDLGNPHVDPARKYLKLYSGIAMALFYNRPRLDAWIDRRALRWSNSPAELRKSTDRMGSESIGWGEEGDREEFKKVLAANINAAAYYWLKRREGAYRESLYKQIQSTAVVPFDSIDSEMGMEIESEGFTDRVKSFLSRHLLGGDVTKMHRIDQEPDVPFEVVDMIRALIFHNDSKNDGAVRLESQLGGIAANDVIENVVHSFAPWDEKVQGKVVELLKWNDHLFFTSRDKETPHCFGPAGQLMSYWLPSSSMSSPFVYGDEAIEWSGMVKSHAEQYLFLSEREDAVIIARPVNHDSTDLIATVAATKGMDVKGKSANWGPQKGYIPVLQRFSKLWRVYADQPDVRDEKIKKFDKKTREMLKSARYPEDAKIEKYRGRKLAVKRPLTVKLPIEVGSTEEREYEVLVDPSPQLNAEDAIFLRAGKVYYDWRNAIDNAKDSQKIFHYDFPPVPLEEQPSPTQISKLISLEVLADNLTGITPEPYLTADYDLLAVGFLKPGYDGPHPEVASAMASGKVPAVTGYISPKQLELVEEFNERCEEVAGYKFGNLTHHGPETQFPGSEYVDYPLLVFDPGLPKEQNANDATYFLIKQGPPGFRDIHLKNYFWEKKKLGHNLWPNLVSEGWLWEDKGSLRPYSPERGYDPRDAAGLLKYVAQQPKPSDKIVGIGQSTSENQQPPPDATELFAALESDADSGDSKAQFALAFALGSGKLKNGQPIEKNDSRAAYWYRRAAIQGHRVAQYNLAGRLTRGSGVEKNETESTYWYLQAAKAGYEKAFVPTGYRFKNGKGIRQDYKKALEWYRKGAEKKIPLALNNLGVMYRDGNGVSKDVVRARKYFEQAAALGNALANKNLGDHYSTNKASQTDLKKALKYYEKAKELGSKTVNDDIKRVKAKLER